MNQLTPRHKGEAMSIRLFMARILIDRVGDSLVARLADELIRRRYFAHAADA